MFMLKTSGLIVGSICSKNPFCFIFVALAWLREAHFLIHLLFFIKINAYMFKSWSYTIFRTKISWFNRILHGKGKVITGLHLAPNLSCLRTTVCPQVEFIDFGEYCGKLILGIFIILILWSFHCKRLELEIFVHWIRRFIQSKLTLVCIHFCWAIGTFHVK